MSLRVFTEGERLRAVMRRVDASRVVWSAGVDRDVGGNRRAVWRDRGFHRREAARARAIERRAVRALRFLVAAMSDEVVAVDALRAVGCPLTLWQWRAVCAVMANPRAAVEDRYVSADRIVEVLLTPSLDDAHARALADLEEFERRRRAADAVEPLPLPRRRRPLRVLRGVVAGAAVGAVLAGVSSVLRAALAPRSED